ncbi:MAG: lamin tail domain-containing protein, partial [Flavobacterium sp.]|nr:lamin tail domain-containing protein [Flavobacterium sp.]
MKNFTRRKFHFLLLVLFFSATLFAQNIAINEVMSSNVTSVLDEDGTAQDWIELYNYGTETVSLNGFGLTDDPTILNKWTFPDVTLNANSYLLIWASSKNRIIVGQPLHTNFKISASEEIILTSSTGMVINSFPATVLPQNVSFGLQPNGTGTWMYFYQATPNASNTGVGLTELLVPPVFSQNSGVFTAPFTLTISHPNPNAVIIYTLDGSEPDINNLNGTNFQYKNQYPIEVNGSPGPFLSESYKSFQYVNPINIVDKSA